MLYQSSQDGSDIQAHLLECNLHASCNYLYTLLFHTLSPPNLDHMARIHPKDMFRDLNKIHPILDSRALDMWGLSCLRSHSHKLFYFHLFPCKFQYHCTILNSQLHCNRVNIDTPHSFVSPLLASFLCHVCICIIKQLYTVHIKPVENCHSKVDKTYLNRKW